MSFQQAFEATMGAEGGGYSVVGGHPTYRGIDRNFHPKWEGWPIIDGFLRSGDAKIPVDKVALLNPMVEAFYEREFWKGTKCDQLDLLSPAVAAELFDSSVNCGGGNGIKFLQAALNMLNVNGTLYQEVTVDGGMGPKTLAAAKTCIAGGAVKLLFRCQNGEQYIYYKGLPQREKMRGWFGRTG